jgi:uncharacterized membrane protein
LQRFGDDVLMNFNHWIGDMISMETGNATIRDLLVLAAFALLVMYHIHFYFALKRNPAKTSIGLTNQLRAAWVATMSRNIPDVIPVQTLRNQIMSASFLASTAVLLSLAMLHVAFTPPSEVLSVSHILHFLGDQDQALWRFKWLALAIDLFFAFFSFTLAIRHFNHASFMVNIPEQADPRVTQDLLTQTLNRGAIYNTMGMRGYYFTIPLIMWLFSPIWLLVGVVALVIILYFLDRLV